MEEKKGNKVIWLLIPASLIIGILLGLSVYWWQKTSFDRRLKDEKAELQADLKKADQKIEKLEDQIDQMASESKEETTVKTVTATTGTEGSGSSAIFKTSTEWCFVKRVYASGGKNYLEVDYIQFLTGAEADAAAIEDGKIPPGEHIENDYYIRNQNPKLRTFEVASTVEVALNWYNKGTMADPEMYQGPSDFATLKHVFDTNDPNNQGVIINPYKITLRDDQIVKIEQMYIP